MWNFNWPIFHVSVCVFFFCLKKNPKTIEENKCIWTVTHIAAQCCCTNCRCPFTQDLKKKKKERPSVPWNNGTISEYQCSALHISIQGKHTGWRKYHTDFMFLPYINTPHPQQVIAHKSLEWLELQRWMKRTYSSHVTCTAWISAFPPLAPC